MFIERKLKSSGSDWLKQPGMWFIIFFLAITLFLFPTTAFGQTNSYPLLYTVKPGDYLLKIAVNLGSPNFWKPIYEANRDKISNPDLIYPDQEFLIPRSVVESDKFIHPAGTKDPQTASKHATHGANEEKEENQQKLLEEFRKAFTRVVESEKTQKVPMTNAVNGLEIGGLVINQTKTKMGSDFFNVFYKYWEAPKNSGNFMLTITEQPIPSLGTLVTIKIDNHPVFKTRLQPRFAVIEELAKRAVIVSYQSLIQQLTTSSQLTTY